MTLGSYDFTEGPVFIIIAVGILMSSLSVVPLLTR